MRKNIEDKNKKLARRLKKIRKAKVSSTGKGETFFSSVFKTKEQADIFIKKLNALP